MKTQQKKEYEHRRLTVFDQKLKFLQGVNRFTGDFVAIAKITRNKGSDVIVVKNMDARQSETISALEAQNKYVLIKKNDKVQDFPEQEQEMLKIVAFHFFEIRKTA